MTTIEQFNCPTCHGTRIALNGAHICLNEARAQSQTVVYSTLHAETVALRSEVERQRAEIWELNREIRALDDQLDPLSKIADVLEQANDCIERQLSDLESLRAAHDGTSVDWRTR